MSVVSRSSKAFTLVELLTTIAIIAILVTTVVVVIPNLVSWSQQTADKQTLTILNDALTRYKCEGGGVLGLTSAAPIKNVLTRLQTPINWAGTTHQFLQVGKSFLGRSIDCKGSGTQYRFTRYNTYTEESGGTSPTDLGPTGGNLVGWWKFDEGSGTTTADSSGNGNDGTLVNSPAWATGHNGGGLVFDGVSNYIQLPASLPSLSDFTVSAWVKATFPHTNAAVWGSATGNRLMLRITSEYLELNGSSHYSDFTPSNNDTWVFLTVIRSGTIASYYRNGSFVSSWSVGSSSVDFANSFLGTDSTGYFGSALTGTLDEVRIHNRALSASEVQQLYNSN